MIREYPLISVVLNVYNEKDNIERCLSRIREQNYPQDKIEIIVVDDDSTDNTVMLAKKFNVKVVRSGHKNRERAKSVGLGHAKGDLILLMDADVFLISNNYIADSVELLLLYPRAVATQTIRWHYERNDYIINRYCNLFGFVDPLVMFLGKRGALMHTEKEWPYKETIIYKGKNYFLVRFTVENLPTVGAQGYIIRKNQLLKTTWKPYFFHLDTAYELVKMGNNEFIMTLFATEHKYVDSLLEYFGKLCRNMRLYMELKKYRTYAYNMNSLKLLRAIFLMMTFLYPFYQSINGFIKKPDRAWFLHPIFCFTVPILYGFVVIKASLLKIFLKNAYENK